MENVKSYTQKSQGMTKNQKWVIASTSSGFALQNMDVLFLSFAMSSMISELHLAGAEAGLISSFTNLGMLLGGLFFGFLGDKVGRVKTFNYTIFIFAFATGLLAFANNINLIYGLRFLAGVGAGGEYGVGITLIAENFPHKDIGKMSSIAAVGGQIGAIIAAIIAAIVIPLAGWHMLFLVGVVPVLLTFFIRRNVHESQEFIDVKAKEDQDQNNSLIKDVIKEMFATPKLAWQSLGLMIMVTVQIAGYFGLMNWLPIIVQKQLNLNVSSSSLWMVATIIGMSSGMLVFGTIFDKLGARKAYAIFLIGSAIMVYALILAHDMISMILIGAVVGFFSDGMFGGYGAIVSRLYPTEIRSSANNVIVNIGQAIGGFSSVVIGFLMDHGSLTWVMCFLSTMYLVSLMVMLTLPGLKKLSGKR